MSTQTPVFLKDGCEHQEPPPTVTLFPPRSAMRQGIFRGALSLPPQPAPFSIHHLPAAGLAKGWVYKKDVAVPNSQAEPKLSQAGNLRKGVEKCQKWEVVSWITSRFLAEKSLPRRICFQVAASTFFFSRPDTPPGLHTTFPCLHQHRRRSSR